MDGTPIFPPISVNQSRRNFNAVCHNAKIGVELPVPAAADTGRVRTALGPSIMQQERDFRNAIQPDSPVSALLQYVALPDQESGLTSARRSNLLSKPQPSSGNPPFCASSTLPVHMQHSVPLEEARRMLLDPRRGAWRQSERRTRMMRRCWKMSRGRHTMRECDNASWPTRRLGSYRR